MSESVIPIHAIKGRGTATRMAHRFESVKRDAFDDGWGTLQVFTFELCHAHDRPRAVG